MRLAVLENVQESAFGLSEKKERLVEKAGYSDNYYAIGQVLSRMLDSNLTIFFL